MLKARARRNGSLYWERLGNLEPNLRLAALWFALAKLGSDTLQEEQMYNIWKSLGMEVLLASLGHKVLPAYIVDALMRIDTKQKLAERYLEIEESISKAFDGMGAAMQKVKPGATGYQG